jgi:hypothetical protein
MSDIFDNPTRINFDLCPTIQTNNYIHDYIMTSYYKDIDDDFKNLTMSNRRLQYSDGKGISSSKIDIDSQIKNDIITTHDKEKKQFNVRNFQASPSLYKGEPVPVLEHILQSGQSTTVSNNSGVREHMHNIAPLHPSMYNLINGEQQALDIWKNYNIGQNSKDILKRIRE